MGSHGWIFHSLMIRSGINAWGLNNMALLIKYDSGACIVYGSRTGKTYFIGSFLECEEEVKRRMKNYKARVSRRAKDEAMASIGMVKVRGAMGGTYYE